MSGNQSINDGFQLVSTILTTFNEEEKLGIVASLFEVCAAHRNVTIPEDFLPLCIKAASNLSDAGRSNVLYRLAKALGTKRNDGSDTLLPVRRFPMGLIEHCVNFYTATSTAQVKY